MSSADQAEVGFFEILQKLLRLDDTRDASAPALATTNLKTVCGADAAYSGNTVIAVASLLDAKTGALIEQKEYSGKATFPYVPGLFFLREGPFVSAAVSKLSMKVDVVCFDAHGKAHPRKAGLATICGAALGIPSVGISKSRLAGTTEEKKSSNKFILKDESEEVVGIVTFNPRKYWSPGYSVSMNELYSIIRSYRGVCEKSIAESHNLSRKLLRRML